MNAQDKAEALRLIQEADEFCPLALSVSLTELRALIERQPDDTDGEMWRFCVEHGFPWCIQESPWIKDAPGWLQSIPSKAGKGSPFSLFGKTPAEAVQAAMAALREKA